MNYEYETQYPMAWIYEHIHPEDRPHVIHEFVWVASTAETEIEFVEFMSTSWTFGANKVILGYAKAMVDAVKDPHGRKYPETVLRDLQKQLGVRILPGNYVPLNTEAPPNPVGEFWPEETKKWGTKCHHPTSGLTAQQLAPNWTDERGTFVLRQSVTWAAPYYYYLVV
jgi:hypothetical protein